MANTKKFYVVWNGKTPGVYEDWLTCKLQTDNFPDAKYKSYPSKAEAEKAYIEGYSAYCKKRVIENSQNPLFPNHQTKPQLNSLAVDAAWNTITKEMEYQGVYTATKELIFRKGPFQGATNNIGEFLALVHGLALLKQQNSSIPIYSDSITAIAWVRQKKHKSVVLPTEENLEVFELLQRAELWLHNNTFITPILKWQTKLWGEIPADFGRK